MLKLKIQMLSILLAVVSFLEAPADFILGKLK